MHQGIEAGLRHINAPKSPPNGHRVTPDPYHAYIDALREQQAPGYLRRKREAEAAARVRQRELDAEAARGAEAGRARLAELGIEL